jgi:hypothetical protein
MARTVTRNAVIQTIYQRPVKEMNVGPHRAINRARPTTTERAFGLSFINLRDRQNCGSGNLGQPGFG